MKAQLVAIAALPLLTAAVAGAYAQNEACGVGMPITKHASFDKTIISTFASFVADGELVKDDGSHACSAANVSCDKKSKVCETTDVPVHLSCPAAG
jgi:hypothetical protein